MADEKKTDKKDDDRGCILFSDDLLRNYGIISVFGDIDHEKAEEIIEKLIWTNGNLPSEYPISLVINSFGGYLSSALSITAIMNSIEHEVHTYALGECFSAAALMFMAGSKNHRYIFRSTRLMIHHFSSGFSGDYNKFKDLQKEYDSSSDYLISFISEKTGNSIRTVKQDMKKNKYFISPEEAIKYGICDKIVNGDILGIIMDNINDNHVKNTSKKC